MKNLNDFQYIILKYLWLANRGVTTRRIALKTHMSWATAKKYLRAMSGIDQPSILEVYREGNRIRWRLREEMLDVPTWEDFKKLIDNYQESRQKKTRSKNAKG